MQVYWDDIPEGLQRRIYGLEKDIAEIELRKRMGWDFDAKRIVSLEARVDKLIRPFYRP